MDKETEQRLIKILPDALEEAQVEDIKNSAIYHTDIKILTSAIIRLLTKEGASHETT